MIRHTIRDGDKFLCSTNTALPRMGSLETMACLRTFASTADAKAFMDDCETIEFSDDARVVTVTIGDLM